MINGSIQTVNQLQVKMSVLQKIEIIHQIGLDAIQAGSSLTHSLDQMSRVRGRSIQARAKEISTHQS